MFRGPQTWRPVVAAPALPPLILHRHRMSCTGGGPVTCAGTPVWLRSGSCAWSCPCMSSHAHTPCMSWRSCGEHVAHECHLQEQHQRQCPGALGSGAVSCPFLGLQILHGRHRVSITCACCACCTCCLLRLLSPSSFHSLHAVPAPLRSHSVAAGREGGTGGPPFPSEGPAPTGSLRVHAHTGPGWGPPGRELPASTSCLLHAAPRRWPGCRRARVVASQDPASVQTAEATAAQIIAVVNRYFKVRCAAPRCAAPRCAALRALGPFPLPLCSLSLPPRPAWHVLGPPELSCSLQPQPSTPALPA